jgi:hypothetical protein
VSLPPTPTWVHGEGLPGQWRTDRLSWITTGQLTSTYGIDTSEMIDDSTPWTQEA